MKDITCTSCGEPLSLGEFAFNQELCWECFHKKASRIISNTQTKEDKDVLKFMLAITTYTFVKRGH